MSIQISVHSKLTAGMVYLFLKAIDRASGVFESPILKKDFRLFSKPGALRYIQIPNL